MKLMKNNEGQIRIIEAFFASILILSSIALIPSDTGVVGSNEKVLRLTGQGILTALDKDGSLSKLIENKSWTTIRECVQSLLPQAVWFNLTAFDENLQSLNEIQICSGSPVSEKIVATEYLCASSSREYHIYIVRLQLSSVT